jgi:hypothetical protein
MSTMEKTYYVVTCKPEYFRLIGQDSERARMVVAIPQGGFGQDVIDQEEQVKERFLEYLFGASGLDLPRSVEVFDRYFELEPASEFIDLS